MGRVAIMAIGVASRGQYKRQIRASSDPRLFVRGCRLVWPRLGDLGSLSATPCALREKDPGSNPGSPTILWVWNH
jgi:hypothetical protein